jgi:hypothetical protein
MWKKLFNLAVLLAGFGLVFMYFTQDGTGEVVEWYWLVLGLISVVSGGKDLLKALTSSG